MTASWLSRTSTVRGETVCASCLTSCASSWGKYILLVPFLVHVFFFFVEMFSNPICVWHAEGLCYWAMGRIGATTSFRQPGDPLRAPSYRTWACFIFRLHEWKTAGRVLPEPRHKRFIWVSYPDPNEHHKVIFVLCTRRLIALSRLICRNSHICLAQLRIFRKRMGEKLQDTLHCATRTTSWLRLGHGGCSSYGSASSD